MNVSILDNIETAMAALIAGMTTTAGYNFNWSIVNQEDETIGAFPRCVINPTDSIADKETNKDELEGKSSQDFTNEVNFTFLVIGELPAFDTNPEFAIRSTLRHANDDLKKLFGTNFTINHTCDQILYVASQIEIIRRNDVQRPGQLRAIWKVIYSQDRTNPSQYASS